MNRLFSLKVQLTLGLLLGLILGYAFQTPIPGLGAGAATPTPSPVSTSGPVVATPTLLPTATSSLAPFITLPGAWMVRFKLFRNAPPEIVKVTRLSEGRLTVIQPGEDKIQILAADGTSLYEQTFHPDFMIGDPPHQVDEITLIFVLPILEGAHTLIITTPNGEARYEFPSN